MLAVPFLILAWCFVVGACVGSFLNVVAWRLPNRMSLSWPGSHCPSCKKPILLRDNVPVFGWLWLRGRCRSCGVKISPRYPIVEFITGVAFAAPAFSELVNAGQNLPIAEPGGMQIYSQEFLLRIWLYHSVLAALLIVVALFERDGARIPRRFVIVGLVAGLLPPLIVWPELLQPIVADGDAPHPAWLTPLKFGIASVLCGAAHGWVLNTGWNWQGGRGFGMGGCGYVMLVMTFVGAFLGWQAVFTVGCVAAISLLGIRLVGLAVGRQFAYPAAFTASIAIAYVLCWRQLTELPWPGTYASNEQLGIKGLVIIGASVALAVIERLRPTDRPRAG